MYTFVKIKNGVVGLYEGWFLLYAGEDLSRPDPQMAFCEDGSKTALGYLHSTLEEVVKWNWRRPDWLKRSEYVLFNPKPDYAAVYEKYRHVGKLAIRQSGSYLLLSSDYEITEIRTNEHLIWDDYTAATIAIIENDFNAEPEWVEYLSKRFPNQQYRLLNTFSLLDKATIREMLKGIKTVTFMTTFSSFAWYETLLESISDVDVEIIGYCSDQSKWEALPSGTIKVEIVNQLN